MTQGRDSRLALTVARRVAETEDVTSLYLAAADGGALPAWKAGQFLTFRIPARDSGTRPRNYSLSGDPADRTHYRISVHRARPPADRSGLPDGLGSTFMHEEARTGVTLEALPPRGEFVLDERSDRPVILLAGGIGITPLVSMAHALAQGPGRRAWLFHVCDGLAALPLARELTALAADSPSFRYMTPDAIAAQTLQAALPIDDYDACLCGSAEFMQAIYDLLVRLGVKEERIRYEFFGPAKKLTTATAVETTPAPSQKPKTAGPSGAPETAPLVTFGVSGRSVAWDNSFKNLLDFAEAQGLQPPFSCRSGICSTCLRTVEGGVRYVIDPLDMPEPGHALICCSVPDGNVTLDL
jgi:ferredoxin-NADP reductase